MPLHLQFLGTRGEIEPKTRRHRMHTATLITYRGKKILIDCGDSWLKKIYSIHPDHILLTHAHPDHAFGLKQGSPCPVWATSETFSLIKSFPINAAQKHVIHPRTPFRIGGIVFEAFPVLHSIRCPAVGYRIKCGSIKFFYVPDVAYIPGVEEAFKDIQLYIGDGATLWRPLIRKHKKTGEIFGHATVRQQLTWCHKEHVPHMLITHCGSQIVSKEKQALRYIEKYAQERQVHARVAFDGMELTLS